MVTKQDKTRPRTPEDLERKYGLQKRMEELKELREKVEKMEKEIEKIKGGTT